MSWYNTTGRDQDVIVSSRVRFARNLANYPFPNEPRLDSAVAREIIEKIKSSLSDEYTYIDFNDISDIEAASYAERHIVSPEFSAKKTPHALFSNEIKQVDIMVCEEDHLRIQCILSGLSLEEAYRRACEADDLLDDNIDIAFDEHLGYLTNCPTNLGTGMRASVMMFLPAITGNNEIVALQNQLFKIGLTIRGMLGEGSSASGCLYQISNQVTLGITEEETLKKLSGVIEQISKRERLLRQSITGERLEYLADKISRSYGTILNARLMSSSEFLKLYSDIRLGIALQIILGIEYTQIDSLLVNTMPASMAVILKSKSLKNKISSDGVVTDGISELERDKMRAEYIQKFLQ